MISEIPIFMIFWLFGTFAVVLYCRNKQTNSRKLGFRELEFVKKCTGYVAHFCHNDKETLYVSNKKTSKLYNPEIVTGMHIWST